MSGTRAGQISGKSKTRIRCAIYTRKSTEEGLEQDFNSLDAQREACEAYILSQKHEGWSALSERYDDGGFSGGDMDRPALTRLLSDIEAGKIDAVIVYKVDRLTRALADFARIVAIFDQAEVSFVSITQAFNTTTSMGRLTLNVLLSFAQFEREVTAERIRDKIAASKAKGMWMGGTVPIGYRAEARSLVPEPGEAKLVRRIFERYLALGSVTALKAELKRDRIITPIRRHRSGRGSGGRLFSRGKLYALLSNPIYIGRIRHKDRTYAGQHTAILDADLWQKVQDRLAANRNPTSRLRRARDPSPLAGRLYDPEGRKMRPSLANKKGRRYRYYVSETLIEDGVAHGARGWRIPAGELEAAVAQTLSAKVQDPAFQAYLLGSAASRTDVATTITDGCAHLIGVLAEPSSKTARTLLRLLITHIELTATELSAEANFEGLRDAEERRLVPLATLELPSFRISAPNRMQRRGAELRLVLQGAGSPGSGSRCAAHPRLLIEGRMQGPLIISIPTQGSRRQCPRPTRRMHDPGDVSRSLQLAFLAPGPRRAHPRRHSASGPHRRATEAHGRIAVALERPEIDSRLGLANLLFRQRASNSV